MTRFSGQNTMADLPLILYGFDKSSRCFPNMQFFSSADTLDILGALALNGCHERKSTEDDRNGGQRTGDRAPRRGAEGVAQSARLDPGRGEQPHRPASLDAVEDRERAHLAELRQARAVEREPGRRYFGAV